MVGQSSSASGTPSESKSSLMRLHDPLFTTPANSQISGEMPAQISPCGQLASVVQIVKFDRLQRPVVGQVTTPPVGHGPPCGQQSTAEREHSPVGRLATCGLAQSPSHASPILSPSLSVWS